MRAGTVTAIADLSAKAYSHNWERVQRYLRPLWETITYPPQAARLDTGLYGGARRHGSEFYF